MMGLLTGLQHQWLIWVRIFKYLNTGKIKPEELFNNAYVEEVYKSEHVCTATKQLHAILDDNYKKSYLH